MLELQSTTLQTIFEDQESTSFTPRSNSLYVQANAPPPPPPPHTSRWPALAPAATAAQASPSDDSHYENLDDYEADDPDLGLEDYNDYNDYEDEDYEERSYAPTPLKSNNNTPAQVIAEPQTPPSSAVPSAQLNSPSPLQLILDTPRNVESNSPKTRSRQAGASSGSPRMARRGEAMPLSPRKRNEAAVRDRQGVLDGR